MKRESLVGLPTWQSRLCKHCLHLGWGSGYLHFLQENFILFIHVMGPQPNIPFIQLTAILKSGSSSSPSRFFLCSCSPCSREGEGLHSAPGQLLVWQQPVHQSQRQRRVGVRWRLWLELWVRGRGAAQQEEAACGGQLVSWAVKTWPRSGQRGIRDGERERSLQSSWGSLTPPPLHNNHYQGLSHHPLLHLWMRLMSPQMSTHHHHNGFSSHPISKNRREEVSRVEDMLQSIWRASGFFPLLIPVSLFALVLRCWHFPSCNVNNSKPKKRQLGYFRTLCIFLYPQ